MKWAIPIVLLILAVSCARNNYNISNLDTVPSKKIDLDSNIKISDPNTTQIKLANPEKEVDILKYILPIFTLILGIIINRVIDRWNENKRIKKAGRRWVLELYSLRGPVGEQIENIEHFLNSQKGNSYSKSELKIHPKLELKAFESLDKIDLLDYVEKIKESNFEDSMKKVSHVNNFLPILNKQTQEIEKRFSEYLGGLSKQISDFNFNLQELMKVIGGLEIELQASGVDPHKDSSYIGIVALIKNEIEPHKKEGSFNPFEMEKKFFLPLKSSLSKLKPANTVNEINRLVDDCLNSIKGMQLEKKYLNENFSSIKESLNKQKNVLNEIYTDLK